MEASFTYGCAYSFSSINIDNMPSYIEIDDFLNSLSTSISTFQESKRNKICFSNDYATTKYYGQDLELHLFDITKDPQATSFYLSEIERLIGARKSYLDTDTIMIRLREGNGQDLPFYYALYVGVHWPEISKNNQVKNYEDVLNFNSRNFRNGILTSTDFTNRAKCIYEHIQFHPDFENKLGTIKRGTFMDYLSEFSHVLNTLNQAHFHISKAEEQNEQDLLVISGLSGKIGRTLACTGQAKQKPHFVFDNLNSPLEKVNEFGEIEITYVAEKINCEYHLKINHNDKNLKLPYDYNRAYFALKYCSITNRKYIKLAYIGEHWPTKSRKKR